jgi:hypothetical protein
MPKAQAEKAKGAKPIYMVRARQGPGSEYMTTIGAAWPFENGDGLVVKLHFIPVNGWDGGIILVPPKADE